MTQFKIGDKIYFVKIYSVYSKSDPNEPLIGSAKVGKIGRKYITFSEFKDRTEDYYLKEFRYNIEEKEIQSRWSKDDWQFVARDVFCSQVDAAIESERQLLIRALLSRPLESEVKKLPLGILQQIEHCLDLSDREHEKLEQLRQIGKE